MKPLKPTRFEKKWDHKRDRVEKYFDFSKKVQNFDLKKCNIRDGIRAGGDPHETSFQRSNAALWNFRTRDQQINQANVD